MSITIYVSLLEQDIIIIETYLYHTIIMMREKFLQNTWLKENWRLTCHYHTDYPPETDNYQVMSVILEQIKNTRQNIWEAYSACKLLPVILKMLFPPGPLMFHFEPITHRDPL